MKDTEKKSWVYYVAIFLVKIWYAIMFKVEIIGKENIPETGKVDGINFTITGNGINQTVTTANGGKFQIDNLMPGIYTVTEQAYDKYEPQETHRVTVVAGQIAKVTFNNKLKRGDLQVVKSSEDNLVEGVKFHLFGTSLSGDAVDQYAVTDKNGVATFKDVLISGSEPYTLEEVDTAIRPTFQRNYCLRLLLAGFLGIYATYQFP